MSRFQHFAAIDWSGAKGERQKGIAVAICGAGKKAPELLRPGRGWSREDVLRWITNEMPPATLGRTGPRPSLPFLDRGAFFPEWQDSPPDARRLWALVENVCAHDPHLSASSFVDHPDAARHYRRHGGRCGDLFQPGRGRLRLTERAQQEQGLNPYSNFNLVGAAQVGKSSLTGMRLLRRLDGLLPIWPFDPLPDEGSVVVEIYTEHRRFGRRPAERPHEGSRRGDAGPGTRRLGQRAACSPGDLRRSFDRCDHERCLAAPGARRSPLWNPPALTPRIAATEGWTFGVL
jgi:hypothetical protein